MFFKLFIFNIFIDDEFLENYRNPEKMCALGSTKFRLKNASLNGRIHTYNLEIFPYKTIRSQRLPIYGKLL